MRSEKLKLYKLPEELRDELKKPWGRLIPAHEISKQRLLEEAAEAKLVVAVGDATTETLSRLTLIPEIYAIDAKEKRGVRQPPKLDAKSEIKVKNPAGYVSDEAVRAILRAYNLEKPVKILVEGEEDLLALIFFAAYPEGTVVFYGQPNEGVVAAKVELYKERAAQILAQMGVPNILHTG